ncbi:pyridoxal phosphate-dependent transferase [Lasiosphaeria hispida]|uniref:Pyridoxal phosphate-dependent transferase n=1 Tax=Lasiosphaeria hispida TaxID=260671 RepID=A0AAJ0MBH9_9PEZI|nr:pyridoxal phosphate-dependent transferase [Lasiosphaeria hispida]
MSQNGSLLDAALARLLDRRRLRNQLRSLNIVPVGTADFSSNAYLSLSSHPAVQQAFLAQLQSAVIANTGGSSQVKPVPSLLGSGGSRLLDGNSLEYETLEQTIATFHRAPAGLLFNSAMDANVGLFSCIPQPGDAVVYDELIHASVHDGMRMSRAAERIPFAHNCVWGDTGSMMETKSRGRSLEAVLQDLQRGPTGAVFKSGERNIFIAVEGIYSMDGDLAPLGDIVRCVERTLPSGNGYIIVDEAHSVGIFGNQGRGLVCELGLEDRIWARVLGFGKAMGCAGGIILSSPTTRSYLINYARTLIYTTAMGPPSLASIRVTYEFLARGGATFLLHHLRILIQQTHALLLAVGTRQTPPPELFRVNAPEPESPIIPVFTSWPRSLARHCQKQGYMVRPIVAPTVPKGSERIRVCLHAGNTLGEVQGLVAAVEAWVASRKVSGGESEQEVVERGLLASEAGKNGKARL